MFRLPNLSGSLKQTLYYAFGILIMKAIAFVMLPVFTYYLPIRQFGILEIIQTLANFGTVLVGFGLADAMFRFSGMSGDALESKRVAGAAMGGAIVLTLTCLVVSPLIAQSIAGLLPGEVEPVHVLLILIALALEGVLAIPLSWMRMQESARQFFLLTSAKVMLQSALTFIALISGWGVTGVLAAGTVSATMLAVVLVWIQVRQTPVVVDVRLLLKLMTYGMPLVVSGMAAFALAGFDRWWLASVVSVESVAVYAVAAKFASLTLIMLQPFVMWWGPRRFRALRQTDGSQVCARFAAMGGTLGVIAAVTVTLVAGAAIRFLTPDVYHGAIVLVPWLAMIAAIKHAGDMFNLGCFVQEKSHEQMYINLLCSMTGVALMVLLTGQFGVYGLIGSLATAQSLKFALLWIRSQQCLRLPYPTLRLAGVAIGGVSVICWLSVAAEQPSVSLWVQGGGMLLLICVLSVRFALLPHPGRLLSRL